MSQSPDRDRPGLPFSILFLRSAYTLLPPVALYACYSIYKNGTDAVHIASGIGGVLLFSIVAEFFAIAIEGDQFREYKSRLDAHAEGRLKLIKAQTKLRRLELLSQLPDLLSNLKAVSGGIVPDDVLRLVAGYVTASEFSDG